MTFKMRVARETDINAIYEMAKLTGGGFTNLPPNKETLANKLAKSAASFSRTGDDIGDDLFVMVLENVATGDVRGTCQLFSRVGTKSPFYSYRLGTLTQFSQELDRTMRVDTLSLSTDLEGSSEVGGLFLHPHERAGGLGLLIARSRYLFIRQHRARFADQVLAELRGIIDDAGRSAFWDNLGGRFFGMTFGEADVFNATSGNQFIADLMPKHPIYTALLSDEARAVIGSPHPSGRAAMRMLESENFSFARYVDIFDGGPTMISPTDKVRTIADAVDAKIVAIAEPDQSAPCLASHGYLTEFVASYAHIREVQDGIVIDHDAAQRLGVSEGDTITYITPTSTNIGAKA